MREIKWIVIHCSACRPRESPMPNLYHYNIKRDGTLEKRLPEAVVGDHVPFFNNKSIGICYELGLGNHPDDSPDKRCKYDKESSSTPVIGENHNSDPRTAEQVVTMHELLSDLHARYPEAAIVGHRALLSYGPCSCPYFDVQRYYKYLF